VATTIGLLFLDDLRSFAPWISDHAPSWAQARGLDGPYLPPTVSPPPVAIVVMRALVWSSLELAADWLAGAAAIVIVVDPTGDIEADESELHELRTFEREQLRERLEVELAFIDVGSAGLEAAIDEALAVAEQLAAELAPESDWPALESFEPSTVSPSGRWFSWRSPQLPERNLELIDVLRALVTGLCRVDGRPALLDGGTGERIDLQHGTREPIADLGGAADRYRPIAAHPHGHAWLRAELGPDRTSAWSLGPEPARASTGGWGRPIGIDPTARVAWTGGRCYFDWRVLGPRGPALWTPSSHDWPCGHGKKLYGYADNDPLFVHLAADASACMSVYEHDTLITPGLPLRWRDLGRFALAERTRGHPRALLFVHEGGEAAFPSDPFEADEDARDRFVVASLGPSPTAAYVVSLELPTYRLVDDVVSYLGQGDEWQVYDVEHRVVWRERGRMLAGWGPWLTFERDATLWRTDLRDRSCVRLAVVDRSIAAAVALAGTPSVVLISLSPECEVRLKLI
jgi:hypothetical protein